MWDRKALGATFTANCNWNQSDVPAKRKSPDSATYCFLSEILFQNGLIGIQCSTKIHYKDSWVLEMNKHAVSTSALHVYLALVVNSLYFNKDCLDCTAFSDQQELE
jgi:hypothetical protein